MHSVVADTGVRLRASRSTYNGRDWRLDMVWSCWVVTKLFMNTEAALHRLLLVSGHSLSVTKGHEYLRGIKYKTNDKIVSHYPTIFVFLCFQNRNYQPTLHC